jgi:hypothetical protein
LDGVGSGEFGHQAVDSPWSLHLSLKVKFRKSCTQGWTEIYGCPGHFQIDILQISVQHLSGGVRNWFSINIYISPVL